VPTDVLTNAHLKATLITRVPRAREEKMQKRKRLTPDLCEKKRKYGAGASSCVKV
jgi:hypothetical protein